MSESLVLGDLTFELRRSSRRRTVGVTVERDGRLILTAPDDCPDDLIHRVATEKRLWIYTKLAQKDALHSPAPPKEYVSGESFSYLGRGYRLRLVDPATQPQPLRLHQGRFLLRRDEQPRAAKHFAAWYSVHGTPWLQPRAARLAERIGVSPVSIVVRNTGHQWGVCEPDGRVAIHWRTVQFPPRIVDYVLAHELVHLLEPNHGPAFWARLARLMPDFAVRKEWLAQHGATA